MSPMFETGNQISPLRLKASSLTTLLFAVLFYMRIW